MKKILETIVFFGSGPVAKSSLESIRQTFDVEAVITKPATINEMSSLMKDTPVFDVSNKHELNELIQKKTFKSRLGILVDFGIIVEKATIDSFELGIVNAHFSLLPEWRGADPITYTILSGQEKTGVSLMLIDEGLDTGKLIGQKVLNVKPDATTPTLTQALIELSNQMLAEYVPKYIAGEVKPRSQPHPSRATYSRKLTKDDGIIDWQKPAVQIEREIRAFIEWPKSRSTLANKEVIIVQAEVIKRQGPAGTPFVIDKIIGIHCGQDSLTIKRLKPAGKNEMSSEAFLAGHRHLLEK